MSWPVYHLYLIQISEVDTGVTSKSLVPGFVPFLESFQHNYLGTSVPNMLCIANLAVAPIKPHNGIMANYWESEAPLLILIFHVPILFPSWRRL